MDFGDTDIISESVIEEEDESWSPYPDQKVYLPTILSMKYLRQSQLDKKMARSRDNSKAHKKKGIRKHKKKATQSSFFTRTPASHMWTPYEE